MMCLLVVLVMLLWHVKFNSWDMSMITKVASGAAGFQRSTCRRLRQVTISHRRMLTARWLVRGTCETCTHAGVDRRARNTWWHPLQSLYYYNQTARHTLRARKNEKYKWKHGNTQMKKSNTMRYENVSSKYWRVNRYLPREAAMLVRS